MIWHDLTMEMEEKFRLWKKSFKLNIFSPPCPLCKHWDPKLNMRQENYDGFRLCWSDEMHPDFSCFKDKP